MNAQPLVGEVLCPPAGAYRGAKRAVDIVGSVVALVVLAPLLLGIALTIVATSPGSPLFRQRRVGRFGREFAMWKFRTMVVDAERRRSELILHSRETGWLQIDHDPRVTRIGRLLRRTSLDELPQLVNVLRGDMSLVGPRPLPVVEHAGVPAWSASRLGVRPGLTGLWQVTGRTRIPFHEMLRLDCEYVRTLSWWTDLKILLRTIPAVLTGTGAK